MVKRPDQIANDHIFRVSTSLGFSTHLSVPSNYDSYLPFVHISYVQEIGIPTKSYMLSNCHCMVDIWGSGDNRKTVSDMAHALLEEISKEKVSTEGLTVNLNLENISVEVRLDQTTETDLWRAICSFELNIH